VSLSMVGVKTHPNGDKQIDVRRSVASLPSPSYQGNRRQRGRRHTPTVTRSISIGR